MAILKVCLLLLFQTCAVSGHDQLITLDTGNFYRRCNDYLDRLIIKINFNYNASHQWPPGNGSRSSEQMELRYQANDMEFTHNLTAFSSAHNFTINTIFDGYYGYRFEVWSVNRQVVVCTPRIYALEEFVRFGRCDLAEIRIVSEGNCTMKLRSLKEWSVVPYVYMVSGFLLVLSVTIQIVKLFFNKYRHIR